MKEWVEALKEYKVLLGEPEKEELKRISYDSRKAEAGDLFLCMKGSKLDSHDKIPELLEKGVRLFVVEKELEDLPAALGKRDFPLLRWKMPVQLWLGFLPATFIILLKKC